MSMGTDNPHLALAKPLHPARVTVWCAICSGMIIGPFFLTENVTGAVYKDKILAKFIEIAGGKNMLADYGYQKDGARPHRTQEVFDVLKDYFDDQIIGLDAERKAGGGIEWPPYSPDLNVCDFFYGAT